MPDFNLLDYVLLAVIGLSTLSGLYRGLVRQFFDLLAWLLSVYLAFTTGPALGQELNNMFQLEARFNQALGPVWGDFTIGAMAVNVLGFLLVLLLVRFVVELIARLMDAMAQLPLLSTFNRLAGAMFGFIKGTALVFVVAALLKMLPAGAGLSTHVEDSYVVSVVLTISPALYEQFKELIGKTKALV